MTEATDHVQLPLQPPWIFLGYLLSAFVLQWAAPFPTPWGWLLRVLGAVLVIGGLLLGGSAIFEMRKAHTTPDPHLPTTALVTWGPYRFTRNPIYLGFLLIFLGFTLLAGTVWGLILSPFLIGTITHRIIRMEEAYLSQKFKGEYDQYSSLVSRWL